jgi:hypothetical protein
MKDQPITTVAYGEAVGRSFEEKLLLAIIDAYPDLVERSPAAKMQRRLERLRAAKEALFGIVHDEGRPLASDLRVLRWMGAEHHSDRARVGLAKIRGTESPKIRTMRKLADEAVGRFGLPANQSERLRKKFRRQKEKWLAVEESHDDVPEQLELGSLHSVQKVLVRYDIKMALSGVER